MPCGIVPHPEVHVHSMQQRASLGHDEAMVSFYEPILSGVVCLGVLTEYIRKVTTDVEQDKLGPVVHAHPVALVRSQELLKTVLDSRVFPVCSRHDYYISTCVGYKREKVSTLVHVGGCDIRFEITSPVTVAVLSVTLMCVGNHGVSLARQTVIQA